MRILLLLATLAVGGCYYPYYGYGYGYNPYYRPYYPPPTYAPPPQQYGYGGSGYGSSYPPPQSNYAAPQPYQAYPLSPPGASTEPPQGPPTGDNGPINLNPPEQPH